VDIRQYPSRLVITVDSVPVAEVAMLVEHPTLTLNVLAESGTVSIELLHDGTATLAATANPTVTLSDRPQVELREIDLRGHSGRATAPREPGADSSALQGQVQVQVVPPGAAPLTPTIVGDIRTSREGALPHDVSGAISSDFERQIQSNPGLIDGVVLDPESGEVVGYKRGASVSRYFTREGEMVEMSEVGLETPMFDPIDLIPTPGTVARSAAGIGARVSLRIVGRRSAVAGTTISLAALTRMRGVSRALVTRAARAFGRQTATFARRITQGGLEHSFDRHAAQWFGGVARRELHFETWRALVTRATASRQIVPWSVGASETVAHLARIEGKWFVAQFFVETGELATAFVPSASQLQGMLQLLGRAAR
jgi:hypothetical protein